MSKTAFLFAGQGSQYCGMSLDLRDDEYASEVFSAVLRVRPDLIDIISSDEAALNQTVNTQPAIFMHDLAIARILHRNGIVPDYVAGHSVGELPALCFAGAFSAQDGATIISVRARAMQECGDKHSGAMVAVLRLNKETVIKICDGLDDTYAVNFNAHEQIVCACAESQVESLIKAVIEAGGRAIRLKVSGAFHSPFMNDAKLALEKELETISVGELGMPTYSNFTGALYDSSDVAKDLCAQVNSPVQFVSIVEDMLARGVTRFIEVGAGSVLSGLVKKIVEYTDKTAIIEGRIQILSADSAESIEKVIKEFKR